MGLKEAPQSLGEQFVEIRSPTFLDVGTGAGVQFRGEFGMDDGFTHGELLTQEMPPVKGAIGGA